MKTDNENQNVAPEPIEQKRDIFRMRRISARPRRIHPAQVASRHAAEIAELSVAALNISKRQHQPKYTSVQQHLPNVVLGNEDDMDASDLGDAGKCSPLAEKSDCESVAVSTHILPAINIENSTPSSSATKARQAERLSNLDVPSITGRSRSGSSITQASFSSGSFLTTPSIGHSSVFGNDASRSSSAISFMVRERLHSLARDINRRTKVIKEHIQQPPTPDRVSVESFAIDQQAENAEKRSIYSFGTDFAPSPISHVSNAQEAAGDQNGVNGLKRTAIKAGLAFCKRIKRRVLPSYIDPQSKKYLAWLCIVCLCLLYNAYGIPLRATYPYQTPQNVVYWLVFDYICDFVYLLDMTVIKPRLMFMREGLPVKERKETKKRYLNSWNFKLDLLSLLPLDLLYLVPSIGVKPLLRLSRILKIRSYFGMFYLLDNMVKSPYMLRIGKTLSYMVYMIHCNGCLYYYLSAVEGIGSSDWAYNGDGNAYLRCFYFAAKLATSIGNNPDPQNFIEYVYMTICWMLGVFVFALLLGQIRDIVATANKNKETFRKTMDAALDYCAALNLPGEMRDKVREWFVYTWQQQKTLSENQLLDKLPRKLRTDLAISVHYEVLNKVQLFQDCDTALLRDLVLKLQPVLYLPGDYVCRKGEVGKEMYIVNKGVVEVVGGPDNNTVFATLKEGSVFGEISLLALAGGNRRTADVRSKGFSNLFVLSKQDLNETIRDYPDAQRMLKRKARKLIKHDEEKKVKKPQNEIEKACEVSAQISTPRLLPVVAQFLAPETTTGKLLQRVLDEDEMRRTKQEKKRTTSAASDCSNASSTIVDDVMSGMPIDDIIKLHYKNGGSGFLDEEARKKYIQQANQHIAEVLASNTDDENHEKLEDADVEKDM